MKRVRVIVTLVALALMMSSFSSLVSAQTVWRDGEQFKVVNSNQVVLFNISNVSISVPNDAKDINVTIHARFRLLRAPDIVNVRAFVCEGNSNNVVFTLSSSGSKRVILKAHMEPNQISSWNVTFCSEDICSNTLDVNLTLVNVSPIDGAVKISNAYVVLSNRSSSLEVLIPTRDFVGVTVVYREENITFRSEVENVSSQNPPQNNNSTPWAGIIGVGILLAILIPTVAFLFSEDDRGERGRVAWWSLLASSISVVVVLIIIRLISWNLDLLECLLLCTIIALIITIIWRNNLNRDTRASLISAFVTLLIILNVYLLLQNQVRPSDLFLLLWLFFIIFGVGPTFVLIGGGENGAFFTFGYLLFLIIPLEISIPYPIYGLALIALSGYAIVFVQSSIKADIKRKLLSGQKETLETFYNLILGAFILPSTVVLGYAFVGGSGISNVRLEMARDMFKHLFFLYLGMTLTSVLLLWADDITQPQDRRRLTLQNAIAMLLIVLGIGGLAILEINLGWRCDLSHLVFCIEGFLGAAILALFNTGNQ